MAVAAVLLPIAVLLEASQALTPDRTADLATAICRDGRGFGGAARRPRHAAQEAA